jgi:hypothetical protein
MFSYLRGLIDGSSRQDHQSDEDESNRLCEWAVGEKTDLSRPEITAAVKLKFSLSSGGCDIIVCKGNNNS